MFPSIGGRCVVCRHMLHKGEEYICVSCLADLPYTHLMAHPSNVLEKLFWEHIPIERATSLFTYYRKADSHQILRDLKYHNRPGLGCFFGRMMGRQLRDTDFFDTIDMIVPVPLARERFRKRGYNQSEMLADGLHEITGIPVRKDIVKRVVSNKTQTSLTRSERMRNVEGIFQAVKDVELEGKHILLVDDVVTSGSTMISCAKALGINNNMRFSILALAMSASVADVPYYREPDDDEWANQEGEVYM